MTKSCGSARDPPAVESEEESREEEEVSFEEGTEVSESESEPEPQQTQNSGINKNNFGREKGVEGFLDVYIGLGDPGIESWIAKNGMAMIQAEKRDEIKEQWKKLNVAEIEIHAKKLEWMIENTKLVLEAIKSSSRQ